MLADINWLVCATAIILVGTGTLIVAAAIIAGAALVRAAIHVVRRIRDRRYVTVPVPVIDGDHSDVPQLAAVRMRKNLTAAAGTELHRPVKR